MFIYPFIHSFDKSLFIHLTSLYVFIGQAHLGGEDTAVGKIGKMSAFVEIIF